MQSTKTIMVIFNIYHMTKKICALGLVQNKAISR